MNETQTAAVHPLEEMGISREVVQAFDWMGFQNLTAIQQKCIPLMMDGHDIIAIAPTGTGKTLGFGIPMLEYVNLDDSNIQEVVLAPTRELAQQIADELTHLAHFIKGLKIAVMGCIVNGPGEAREADIGIAGGAGEAVLFEHGEIVGKIPEDGIIDALAERIKEKYM